MHFGKQKFGFELNSVGAFTVGIDLGFTAVPRGVLHAMKYAAHILKLNGKVKTWVRHDIGIKTIKTSMKGGPEWSRVLARITVDAKDGRIIDVEGAKGMPRDREHRLLRWDKDVVDSQTWLLYKESS